VDARHQPHTLIKHLLRDTAENDIGFRVTLRKDLHLTDIEIDNAFDAYLVFGFFERGGDVTRRYGLPPGVPKPHITLEWRCTVKAWEMGSQKWFAPIICEDPAARLKPLFCIREHGRWPDDAHNDTGEHWLALVPRAIRSIQA
jgi:hypothetical protein